MNWRLQFNPYLSNARYEPEYREAALKFLRETNQVESYLTQIIVCSAVNFFYTYPFKDYERSIVPNLLNMSQYHMFNEQEALWNSKYETQFAKRLIRSGFGYTFNIEDADVIYYTDK